MSSPKDMQIYRALLETMETEEPTFALGVDCRKTAYTGMSWTKVYYEKQYATKYYQVRIPVEGTVSFKTECDNCTKKLKITARSLDDEQRLRDDWNRIGRYAAIVIVILLLFSQRNFTAFLIGVGAVWVQFIINRQRLFSLHGHNFDIRSEGQTFSSKVNIDEFLYFIFDD